jgi:hypothetical protein
VGLRSETEFINYWRFNKAVDEFGITNSLRVSEHIIRFQRAYQQSNTDSEIPGRFEFKLIENVRGLYRLCQIYVGPNNNFRALVMFPHSRIHGQLLAYWVYAFKKQRNVDRPQIERAKTIARECWSSIEGE